MAEDARFDAEFETLSPLPQAEFLYAIDRNLQIECILDENALLVALSPITGEGHFAKLEFTKGFATELRDFLNKHMQDDE